MLVQDFPISNRTKNACIAAGFLSEIDFEGKTVEQLKEIDGLGTKGVVELRDYLKCKFNIVFKHAEKPKKIKDAKGCRDLVNHFLGHKKFIKWGNELLMAQRLLNQFGLKTLLNVKPNYKVSSLSFYFVEDGQKYIKQFLPSISIEEPKVSVSQEDVPQEEVKLDLDLLKYKKPKSIQDFING